MPFKFLAAEDNWEKALAVVKGHAQDHHNGALRAPACRPS